MQIMDEALPAWGPAPATWVHANCFRVQGQETYDEDIEKWEFPPGSIVLVEEKKFRDPAESFRIVTRLTAVRLCTSEELRELRHYL